MVMYGIYNADTLEHLIAAVHKVHDKTTCYEKLFASKLNHWYLSKDEVGHYAINSVLFLTITREKNVNV